MDLACQILINKTREGVHRAGQPVSGVVKYVIDEPMVYCNLTLSFIGDGRCSWSEAESMTHNEGTKQTSYTGTENYVTRHWYALDKLPGTATLPFGSYVYPFDFILPLNIPPSFSNSTCTISYRVEIQFEIPGLFSRNRVCHVEIPVYGHVEHAIPYTPIMFGLDKVLFKPFSGKQQDVKLKVEINRACLSPGQNAKLSFVLTNNTDITVTSIKTQLVCTITYTANCGKQKSESRWTVTGCTTETICIPSYSVANLSTLVPILPQLYSIQHSSVISKNYELMVTVRLPMPHANASVYIPIVIGEREGAEEFIESLEAVGALGEQPPSYREVMKGV